MKWKCKEMIDVSPHISPLSVECSETLNWCHLNCTFRPERNVRVRGKTVSFGFGWLLFVFDCGAFVDGAFIGFGDESFVCAIGCKMACGVAVDALVSFEMNAAFRRSIEIFAGLFFISISNHLLWRFSTLNGPSYGGWNGFLIASFLTKTCVVVFNSVWMKHRSVL